MTAAASAHVRTALGDKAFDEAPSRGLALTLGDAVAHADESSARSTCSDQRNGSIRAIDVNHTTTRSSVCCGSRLCKNEKRTPGELLLLADSVAKVFLSHRSQIFRAVGTAIEY